MDKSQTQRKQRDTMREQLGVDTNDRENSPLLERIEIEHTPFHLVGNEELGYKMTWGKFNLSEAQPKEQYNEEWMLNNSWKHIMTMIAIYVERFWEMKDNMKERLTEIQKEQ